MRLHHLLLALLFLVLSAGSGFTQGRLLCVDQVPWTHETDWHLFRAPSKMLQVVVEEGEDAAGTDAETETAPFDRTSKI
ncbi:hypothetical protein E5288_WYG003704 [Bos mutus]|uniref:Uncharacterized protein n=1 Tax=Bos mutus TaxID=72004 RepID=A0A6B0SJY3_9CETA|nr:hypothetical protein [Bos mutus]